MATDINIKEAVLAELDYDPSIDNANISVAVENRLVTLSGHVHSLAEKEAAQAAARRVRGVGEIVQNIEVRIPPGDVQPDEDIAKRVLVRLRSNDVIPSDHIRVEVENGVVKLSGEVEWRFQRDRAQHVVEMLSGVVGIVNSIAIKPSVAVEQIREKIKAAFERCADVDAEKVGIVVDGGTVTLNGSVRSWTERLAVEDAAWSVPGVTHVNPKLGIQIWEP